jgi:adenylate cyclase
VNTASRIEQLNKHFGTRLLVSEVTHDLVAEMVKSRRMEPVEVKGKRQPVQVFEVTKLKSETS